MQLQIKAHVSDCLTKLDGYTLRGAVMVAGGSLATFCLLLALAQVSVFLAACRRAGASVAPSLEHGRSDLIRCIYPFKRDL